MFQVGQNVLYGTEGVCVITRIEEMKVNRVKTRYYVLTPCYRSGATIFVPADNESLTGKMHPVLSKDEIETLLQHVRENELPWIDDHSERRAAYQEILNAGDRTQVIRLIHALYLRRDALIARSKHLRSSDEQILRDAERLLKDEFALVLNIPQADVPEYIRSRVERGA